ncbi:hypothetical protein IU443_25000 [Nocardia farcinica]|uniref:hypothetical protein n=1 Tax=Nocardia farcinica TaxID=37329 RepID=UPI0018935D7D|nr:hypothetical protein [Nocardia farcinica]MBF6263246.1 hypothetical protein [Nocardia farcinica]MBF6281859.1 hypothetical protein [Nocardia farcinica]MBF6306727.1 hypothetical protein [Nocardia farcinica]MBF6393196.1 hypothetical protein [Nocardia farcinica]MBF6444613.1 hypothetical protein [Nocardia farcinica]
MTGDASAQLETWRALKEQGINGQFKMDTEIGNALSDRCEQLRLALEDIRSDIVQLEYLSGYGGLPSANDLRVKFQQKAVGGAPHDPHDNALSRIDQHIEIVTTMRDAYLAAIGKLEAVDQATGRSLAGRGDQID